MPRKSSPALPHSSTNTMITREQSNTHGMDAKQLLESMLSVNPTETALTQEVSLPPSLKIDTNSPALKMSATNKPSVSTSIPTMLMVSSKDTTTSGPTRTNLTAKPGSTLRTTNGDKESASLPEDSLNLLLDMDLEVLPSLSSVELVEVSTPRLLMSVPILSVRSSRT